MARALPRLTSLLLLASTALPLLGCGAFMRGVRHGARVHDYQGHLLRASSPAGAQALETEADFDSTIRTYVDDKGRPDYLYVQNHDEVVLVYVERDEAVRFERPGMTSRSEYTVYSPIADDVVKLLEKTDREGLRAARAEALVEETGAVPRAAPPSGTLAEAIQRCYALNDSAADILTCDALYLEGAPSLIFDFASPGTVDEQWDRYANEAAMSFCAAANAANRPAFVLVRVGTRARSYACELGRWGEWVEEEPEGSAT